MEIYIHSHQLHGHSVLAANSRLFEIRRKLRKIRVHCIMVAANFDIAIKVHIIAATKINLVGRDDRTIVIDPNDRLHSAWNASIIIRVPNVVKMEAFRNTF